MILTAVTDHISHSLCPYIHIFFLLSVRPHFSKKQELLPAGTVGLVEWIIGDYYVLTLALSILGLLNQLC